jgi:hypothetical protein
LYRVFITSDYGTFATGWRLAMVTSPKGNQERKSDETTNSDRYPSGGAAVALVGDCLWRGAKWARSRQAIRQALLALAVRDEEDSGSRGDRSHREDRLQGLELTLMPGWDTGTEAFEQDGPGRDPKADRRPRAGASSCREVQLAEPNTMVSLGFNLNYNSGRTCSICARRQPWHTSCRPERRR